MRDSVAVLVAFLLGCLAAYNVLRSSVGARCWRDGYLRGFDLAWDEKAKLDEEAKQKRLKELRRRKPRLEVVKGGDKE